MSRRVMASLQISRLKDVSVPCIDLFFFRYDCAVPQLSTLSFPTMGDVVVFGRSRTWLPWLVDVSRCYPYRKSSMFD